MVVACPFCGCYLRRRYVGGVDPATDEPIDGETGLYCMRCDCFYDPDDTDILRTDTSAKYEHRVLATDEAQDLGMSGRDLDELEMYEEYLRKKEEEK